jgi:hypothetical protein
MASQTIRLFTASIASEEKCQETITALDKLKDITINDRTIQNPEELSEKDLASTLGDMEINVKERINLLNIYNEKFNYNIIEILNKLNTMYLFSKTKLLEEYLYHIAMDSNIDPFMKIETAKTLTTYCEKGYNCLEYVISQYNTIPTPIRLESIYLLISYTGTRSNGIEYFKKFLIDQSIECLYRYKSIINLEVHLSENKENYIEISQIASKTFLECNQNMTYYRTLACQYIFNKCQASDELKQFALESLFSFATDTDLDYNLRADAVDVLLNYDDNQIVARANLILMELGANGRTVRSIFENAQNVHQKSIEESAHKTIEFLSAIPNPNATNYEKVRDTLTEHAIKRSHEERAKINTALTRIMIDRAIYGKCLMSLTSILIKLWIFIDSHEYKEDLIERLIDELIDSSEVCSTGYAHRLVNVLSGYTDMNLSISFEEQIAANLQGRLNAIIRDIQDECYQSLIINEMLIPVIDFHLRSNFLKFFRESISKIREGMYQEFRDYMSDTDYDLYFRKAIMSYEGISY